MSRVFILLPLAVALGCATSQPPAPSPPTPPAVRTKVPDYTRIEGEIMHLVNLQRAGHGLDTLIWNAALDKAAKIQAVNMAGEGKMAHDLPNADHPTLKDRVTFVGYAYRRLAENIAYGYPDAHYAVDGWMASSGHRANILDRAVTETGIGVARSATGELYYCQVFGARLGPLGF